MEKRIKKGVIGPVISVFVLVLIVSILAGLTFLFVASLKVNILSSTATATNTIVNETSFFNSTGDALANIGAIGFRNPVILVAINGSSGQIIVPANYSVTSTGYVYNASSIFWQNVNITYTYGLVPPEQQNPYLAVNGTESAGAGLVSYLPLIFLAIIFGAILTLVLRIILPYINLGQQVGGF